MSNISLLSDHVIAYANQNDNKISNLQLQKVLYFIIGDYISEYGIDSRIKEIYDDKMEAWKHGSMARF